MAEGWKPFSRKAWRSSRRMRASSACRCCSFSNLTSAPLRSVNKASFSSAKRIWRTEKNTLVPEVFLDFSPLDRAARRRQSKTSGYLGLESHFHADARVRIWPSGSDWLIFLQTRKATWLVCLICNTEGTVWVSVIALLGVTFVCLYQRRELFA